MKAVIYARYSSDNQREESIEGQIRECTAFAEKNGITILRHYIDRAYSAKTDNRPEFQNMIKDSNKKLFDWSLSGSWTDSLETVMTAPDTRHSLRKTVSRSYPLPKLFLRVRRVSFWNPCWKGMRNITLPIFPRRSSVV